MDTFDCECCELPHANTLGQIALEDYTPPTLCKTCIEHWGKPLELERDHAREYRRRMEVAIRAAYDANDRADEFEAEMQRAFRSRERTLEALDAIARFHQRDEKHGGCTCRKGDCPTLRVLSDPWLVDRLVDYSLKEDGRKRASFRSDTSEDQRLRQRRFDAG